MRPPSISTVSVHGAPESLRARLMRIDPSISGEPDRSVVTLDFGAVNIFLTGATPREASERLAQLADELATIADEEEGR